MGVVALEYSGLSTVAGVTAVDQLVAFRRDHRDGGDGSVARHPANQRHPTSWRLAFTPTQALETPSPLALDTRCGLTCRPLATWSSWPRTSHCLRRRHAGGQRRDRGQHRLADGDGRLRVLGSERARDTPTEVGGSPGDGSANVTWNAPSSGGSPMTSYTITPYIGATAQPPTVVSGTPPATSAVVPGLTNGTTYTFTVTATNAVGTGPASAADRPGHAQPRATGRSGVPCRPGRWRRSAPS